jgi:hypothetical protein
MPGMRRREFIVLLGGVASTWPLAVRAERPNRVRTIGIQLSGAEADHEIQAPVGALRQGLQDLGWIEGHKYRFEYRWAANDPKLLQRHSGACCSRSSRPHCRDCPGDTLGAYMPANDATTS